MTPSTEVQALLQSGQIIQGIKLHRQQARIGLKEAKDDCEAWLKTDPAPLGQNPYQIPLRTLIDTLDTMQRRGWLGEPGTRRLHIELNCVTETCSVINDRNQRLTADQLVAQLVG